MRTLRLLGLTWGLTATLAVLLTRNALRRYAARLEPGTASSAPGTPATAGEAVDVAWAVEPPVAHDVPSRAVARVRVVVGGVGLLVLMRGVWMTLHVVQPASYLWLVVWLGGAVVVHDAVLVPLLSILRAGAHRRLPALPDSALALVKAGFLVGGLLVLVVTPEIWAQHLGPLNPTVLPGDYATRLVTTLTVIALLTTLAATAVLLRTRRTTPPAARTRNSDASADRVDRGVLR